MIAPIDVSDLRTLWARRELVARTAISILAALATALLLAGSLPSTSHATQPTAEIAKKKTKKRTYCTKRKRPKGCVKPPREAERPAGVGSGNSIPTPPEVANGGGLGGGPGVNRTAALEWAASQRESRIWRWHCQRFVEEAYGTRRQFPTAIAAVRALKLMKGAPQSAPRGTLVYFAADAVNRGFGHVGLSLGNGRMISALDRVRVTDINRSAYWRTRYLGWAEAPASWPGRIPPPPASVSDFDSNASVRITAPASNSELSGPDVPLLASASGVGGVAFDAYYASNPRDPATRSWKPLGTARQDENGSWSLTVDTTQIPDQGASQWGTINIAAIALDARGRRTGVRDYRRVEINNAAGPLIATPPTQGQTLPSGRRIVTVDNRVTDGMGMREDTTPARLTTKPWILCGSRGCNLNGTERSSGGTYDAAVCQATGERTTNGWDSNSSDDTNPELFESTRYYGVRLTDGTFGYISEVWIRAADRGGLGLPAC